MTHLKSVLASNLRALRKERGLSQAKLAEKVDTATTYIAMIESERRTPSFEMIERIAEALHVEAPELFSTKNYPAESADQLHDELIEQFDKFLKAAVKQVEEKK
jgi:transcriptional regulator with XRE-family HTH domain